MDSVSTYLPIILHIVYGIFILIIGWLVANMVAKYIRGRDSEKYDETLIRVFAQAVKIFILGFVVIVVLAMYGIQTASLIAVIGGLAIGIGMAWQGVLKDFAAGIVILFMRPFKVDDLIIFGNTKGVVEEIGVMVTKMHDVNNLDLTVPNSQIWGNVITNMSANDIRRLDLTFDFGLNDNMDRAMEVTREILDNDERVLSEPEPVVAILELGDHSIVMRVRSWTKSPNYWPLRYTITKSMKERFDEEGLSIPYPHQHDVHFFQEN